MIVIDEGQRLAARMLDELRFVVNPGMASPRLPARSSDNPDPSVTLILKAFEAIYQRVALPFPLRGLSEEEKAHYVAHHLLTVWVTS